VAFVDGSERLRVDPPAAIAPRAWVLGVIAVQATVEEGRAVARLRAGRTGSEPRVIALPERALVQVALVGEHAPAPIAPPADEADAAIALFLDGEPLAAARLAPAARAASPPTRAFGHVYCRWLRDGGCEPGFDLTDFLSLPEGEKYPRLVARPLAAGQLVSYRLAIG